MSSALIASILLQMAVAAVASAAALAILERFTPGDFLANSVRETAASRPVRQLGGLAVLPAAILAASLFGESRQLLSQFAVLAAVAATWLLGLADDRYHLPPLPKLVVQLLAGWLAATAVAPGLSHGLIPATAETLLATLLLVGFVNMTNFMDGMDLMTVVGAGLPIAALSAILLAKGETGLEVYLCLLLVGALIGFAPFNRPAARLYLGDSGSLVIGLCAGLLALRALPLGLATALLPFGYYLGDTATTVLLRARAGENLLQAHSRHAYQAAMKVGRGPRWIAVRVAVTNAALSGLAAIAAFAATPAAQAGTIAIGAALCTWTLWRLRRAGRG